MNNDVNLGLEGITVAETRLSHIDGERGRLIVAGHDMTALAGRITVEDMCALLWHGSLPDAAERQDIQQALGAGRVWACERFDPALARLHGDGMSALRALLARLDGASFFELAGATATFAAAWWRVRSDQPPVAPDPRASHAADYYRMATGRDAEPARVRAMDTYLTTVADHGMNASTFTARTVASTGSDEISAVVAAIGALKGPLHGGAPGPVLEMLRDIGSPERAEPWLRDRVARGERIMGMGHRVYRVRDPRAAIFERAALELGGGWIELARHVETVAERVLCERKPDRRLRANVEFYTAVLLDALALDPAQFAPTFATGRVVGWCAHIAEQRQSGRLIRPRARYVGPSPSESVSP